MSNHHRFLLLDSDHRSCSYVAEMIRCFKYDVDCIDSVDAAPKHLENNAYLGLILDTKSVARAGAHLPEWLQARNGNEPVILISSGIKGHLQHFSEIIGCGNVVHIIKKPVNPLVLRDALYSVMRQSNPQNAA